MDSVASTTFLTSDKLAGTIIEYYGGGGGSGSCFFGGGEGSTGFTGDLYADMIFGVGFLASSDYTDLTSLGVTSLFC